jgi:hypothetical protein
MRAILMALALVSVLIGAPPARDLKQYEKIGPFMSRRGSDLGVDGKVREFLWTHWREHRLGTVTVTRDYVEGSIRATYFVEPDNQGQWLIVESMELIAVPQVRKWTFSCDRFERVETNNTPIAEAEARGGEQYLLHPLCGGDERLW